MRRKLSGDHCQCSVCGEYFNSTAAFDKHRTGQGSNRRCLLLSDMFRAGMAISSRGWWVTSAEKMPASTVGHWLETRRKGSDVSEVQK